MITVKRMIIYWLPTGNQSVLPAQWSVRRFEICEAPEALRRFIQASAQAAQSWKFLIRRFLELKCILFLHNVLLFFCNLWKLEVPQKTQYNWVFDFFFHLSLFIALHICLKFSCHFLFCSVTYRTTHFKCFSIVSLHNNHSHSPNRF